MLGEHGATLGVIGVARKAAPVFVDDAGQRIREPGVFVNIIAACAIGKGDRRQIAIGIVCEGVRLARGVGHRRDPVLAVVAEAERTAKRIGHDRESSRPIVSEGLAPAGTIGNRDKLPLRIVGLDLVFRGRVDPAGGSSSTAWNRGEAIGHVRVRRPGPANRSKGDDLAVRSNRLRRLRGAGRSDQPVMVSLPSTSPTSRRRSVRAVVRERQSERERPGSGVDAFGLVLIPRARVDRIADRGARLAPVDSRLRWLRGRFNIDGQGSRVHLDPREAFVCLA